MRRNHSHLNNVGPILFALFLFWSASVDAQDRRDTRDGSSIERTLDQETSISYIQHPLSSILVDLAKKHSISIKMDDRIAKTNPKTPGLPVNIELKNVSLRSALRLLLRQHQLEYVNEGNRLFVTTTKFAETLQRERRFKLNPTVTESSDALIAAIRETILTDDSMGSAKVEKGELVIQVRRALLPAFESLISQIQPPGDQPKTWRETPPHFVSALEKPANLHFALNPLPSVIEHISRTHDLPIVIDNHALRSSGISVDIPITFELNELDLGRSLRFMLHKYDLSYVVENQVLKVTTRTAVESSLKVGVHSLPVGGEPHMQKAREIFCRRSPQTWAENGGPNRLAIFQHHFIIFGTNDVNEAADQYVQYLASRFAKRN